MKSKKVALITSLINFLTFILKLIIALITNSISLLMESLHSISDSLSSLIAYFTIKFANFKPDKKHPYGHKRLEPVGSLFISLILIVVILFLIKESIEKVFFGTKLNLDIFYIAAITLILPINYFVYKWEYSIGKKEKSYPLVADSMHTKMDIFLTLSVILSLTLIYFGFPVILDSIIAIIIASIFFKNLAFICKDSIETIIGRSLSKEFLIEIKNICLKNKEVKSVHKIRCEEIGNHIYLDFHLTFNKNISISKCHKVVLNVKREIFRKFKNVKDIIIFVHPYKEKCEFRRF